MRRKSVLFLVLLFSIISLSAKNSKLFTADRELSSSLINKIYQDRNGMIWVATEDGLNRYDGTKFTIYKHESENENSLLHNLVRCLFEDDKGHFIIGCYRGIQLYNPSTDRFSAPAVRKDGTSFSCNINMIIQRRNGEIWVSGNEISRLIIENDKLTALPVELPVPTTVTDYIMEDKAGNMWIVTDEYKVFCLTTDGQFIQYPVENEKICITALSQDYNGNIFIGTIGDGLFRLDSKTQIFKSISFDYKLSIKSLYTGNQDELYIGTDGDGLKVYNSTLDRITNSQIDNSYFDLTKSKVHSIVKDSDSNFWLAIYQKGVMMIPAQSNSFKYIGHKSVSKNLIGSFCVTALIKDSDNALWVGTDNDGIYRITDDGKKSTHFKGSHHKNSVPSIVINLFEDSEKNLWCGSFTNGLGRINKKNGEFTPVPLLDANNNLVHRAYCITEDSDKRLWIATMGGGLFCYDLKTQTVHCPDIMPHNKWISSIFYEKEGNKLYAGTYNGIAAIDLETMSEDYDLILPQHIINSIFEDSRGRFWISTSDGLASMDMKAHSVEKYTIADGLPSDAVYSVLEDEYSNLWISTDAGISRFNPESGRFINYFVGDGLQGNEFSKNTAFKEQDGTMWFGGVNGVTYFNPKEIINPSRKWNVAITDFYLHNMPVRKGMKSGRYQIIDQPVFEAEEFHLSDKDNAFTVEFSTKEFNSPERISFMYSMNNGEWIELRAGVNRISFNNLPSGIYSLQIRAKDYDLLSDIKEIKVRIAYPWYQTVWARLGYSLFILFISYIVYLQITHRMRAKRKLMEHLHAEEINEAKLQFFINISHEIRTPMSLVISPLKKLMSIDDDAERQRNYRTIYRNSERILNLVNQLMDIRKIDKGQMVMKFGQTDLTDLLQDVCNTFDYQVTKKNIDFVFLKPLEPVKGWVDQKNFDKIIMNLLSNAVKFTPDNGRIEVSLSTGNDDKAHGLLKEYIEISITDTGIGIDKQELNRIFERFYQINNSHNNSNVGTGIGLHLTKSLVELHHGIICVENNETGTGSRFIVRIPLGCKHLNTEELLTEKDVPAANSVENEKEFVPELPHEEEETRLKSKTKHRVVVVEDDEEIRKYIIRELSSDYHIIDFENGKEALAYILNNPPKLIISDIMMPVMDGTTLCRKVKQNVHINHIPILLLTAKNREEDNMDALDIGADGYMTKPFNIDLLKKSAENLIKSRDVLRNCFTGNQEQEVKKPIFEMQSTDNKLMDRIMNVINRNLSNQELNVEMITKEVGISRVHLHRKLKELTNQSTRDLIKNVRLKHAAMLLSTTHYNVTEITDMTGFSSITLFSRSFKELYGMTPTEYAAKNNNKTPTEINI